MTDEPRPIDTSAVELDPALEDLVEALAAQVHAAWAQRRISEGWRHGSRRDDSAKTHPGLVPYDQLPEQERAYDRATVIATLKSILALGYRIQPPGEDSR